MKKLKIGVLGVGRGKSMWEYCYDSDYAEIVAICDKWEKGLRKAERDLNTDAITYYTDFDTFLAHDTDVVVLANYANEHAPFAIKAMEAGKDVISEVLPVQTMAEAVSLIECIERTERKYCYAENYCYMNAPREMKKLYREGALGTFEYGEGEYLHNCEPDWHELTFGNPNHWRNRMSAFFYCTHSVGPLLHITGLRPKSVTGFECPINSRMTRMGAAAGHTGIEMVTLENGAIIKSIHGVGCSKNSKWYSIYGSKGRIESAREDADQSDILRIYANLDAEETREHHNEVKTYLPEFENAEIAKKYDHGGSDYYCMNEAVKHIAGIANADTVDIFEALDMWMCGFFGYISVLSGGIPMSIPDLRDPAVREKYKNDNRCTDPAAAGDQLLSPYSKGEPDYPDSTYEYHRKKWEKIEKERY